MSTDILRRIAATRAQNARERNRERAELAALVEAAFGAGHSWHDIAQALDVTSRQRVSQIRHGKR